MSDALTMANPLQRASGLTARQHLARLFDAHHRRLHRLALRLTSDPEEARDLTQETFLRAARRPGSVPADEPAAEAWLVRCLVNLCRDRFRRQAVRERKEPFLTGSPAPPDPESAAVARRTVAAALARLSPRRRAVLVLAELEQRPTREIARLLGVTPVTVRWHLAAARRELARLLTSGSGPESREVRDA